MIGDILYNRALDYMRDELYEPALFIFEALSYDESAALAGLCGKHIKYKNALAIYERGEIDAAYLEFASLGDFIDSIPYVLYIEANRAAEADNFGEAADKYLKISGYFDSGELYEKYICLYYDRQFQLGNRDLSKLPLLPLTDDKDVSSWRALRVGAVKNAIDSDEKLNEYYSLSEKTSPVEITGMGIYINDRLNLYYVKDLTEKIIADVPVFFLADSPEKVRYTINFPGSSEYFGTYDDGTLGYETTIFVTITDNLKDELIFSRGYTAYPEPEVYFPASQKHDVYALYDFFGDGETDQGAYESDILPVLRALWQ
jgi:hypothetical protein